MKFTSTSIAVMALLAGSTDARHHHRHPRRDDFVNTDLQNKREFTQLDLNLGLDDAWDAKMTKFMDADNYVKEVRTALMDDDEDQPKPKHHKKTHA